ncbi:MAG TPA: hypothetical protein VGO13_02590 [Solirubrobacterales bacterium]|nr:hypothetical protein [Solirubrobacterales bacterium]
MVRISLSARGVALVAGSIVAWALAAAAPAVAVPVVAADYYGINSGAAFSGSPSGWDRAAAEIAQLGVGTVRRDAFWSAIEPTAPHRGVHSYRWHRTDLLVAALARSGLRWYPILDYGVAWADHGDWQAPPTAAHVRDYAAFAGAMADRYGVGGSFWRAHPGLPTVPVSNYEIWNEPNVRHFWPHQSYAPARLARMYLGARTRVEAADPDGQVVLGGLSAIGVEGFLARMVRAQPRLRDRLQAVAFHPYGGGDHAGLSTTYTRIRALRAALDRLVPSHPVPIEITETGWAVPPVPESWRARRLARLATELPGSNCEVTRFIVFDWRNDSSSPASTAGFGIVRGDGSFTASARALQRAIAKMRGGVVARAVPDPEELSCGQR